MQAVRRLARKRHLLRAALEERLLQPLYAAYIRRLQEQTTAFLEAAAAPPAAARNLYVSPVGAAGKDNLADVVRRFGCERFDYLIFAFDDTAFDEEVFAPCRIVRRPGRRWEFVREFVTPELVANYGYLFLWPDDIRIHSFSWENFVAAMAANRLQMAQPALAYDSDRKSTRLNSSHYS